MSQLKTEECLNHPKFKKLVASRGRISLLFSLIIFMGYSIFVLGMALAPELMSMTLSSDSSITYGILLGIVMIITSMVSSGIYMRIANQSFDPLKQELLIELDHE